ncbi:hypothetical protein UAY_02246 [Enterococcus moraviensis ATCC BAA-383]|uniref:Lipoprotein n=1 Tax=Enterococcus moraviensis ATCC BAA-383 TaxID=1158609 RepID=R2QR43_9ENTE|nr:hypothetical protein [Enterococcus moraviensis]EOH98977.1 hypothetical protein UAY_02246 [Enterococcus moraviensis ATCC BAA-383]EOT71848.1 hypothetical protein I586_01655 [Enterococcus moraviensis ATCC BAA-383]OJG67966.1 hypothetical protein RV09_GL002077 [Enterococcus moraviensis]
MKKIKIITLLLVGLVITGCSGRQEVEEEVEDAYIEDTSSSVEESMSYGDNEVFYEPRDKSETTNTIDENKTATEETKETTSDTKGKVEVIKTKNGNFKVELTEGWQSVEAKELSDNADISLKNTTNEEYYMVLSEAKKDFDSFAAFKSSIDLSDLGERTDEKKESIKYNELKGERRIFTATKDGVEVYYIYDLVESKDYYLQCISWTLATKKDNNKKDMIKIMNSLTELEK